jgi:hypothetical protein
VSRPTSRSPLSIGSGRDGSYTGARDNISVARNGVTTTFDFEAPSTVPEPASVVLFGTGALRLAGLGAVRRRRPGK